MHHWSCSDNSGGKDTDEGVMDGLIYVYVLFRLERIGQIFDNKSISICQYVVNLSLKIFHHSKWYIFILF